MLVNEISKNLFFICVKLKIRYSSKSDHATRASHVMCSYKYYEDSICTYLHIHIYKYICIYIYTTYICIHWYMIHIPVLYMRIIYVCTLLLLLSYRVSTISNTHNPLHSTASFVRRIGYVIWRYIFVTWWSAASLKSFSSSLFFYNLHSCAALSVQCSKGEEGGLGKILQ